MEDNEKREKYLISKLKYETEEPYYKDFEEDILQIIENVSDVSCNTFDFYKKNTYVITNLLSGYSQERLEEETKKTW